MFDQLRKFTTFALGEEESKAAPTAASPQEVARDAASLVRERTSKSIENAWAKLEEEIKVQKLVWESIARTNKREKPGMEALQKRFEGVLEDAKSCDRFRALASLEEITLAPDQSLEPLGHSMLAACKNTVKQEGLAIKRAQLAQKLDAAANTNNPERTESQSSWLEAFVSSCDLDDKKLDRKVRQGLRLPLPTESAPVKGPVDSNPLGPRVVVTGSRTLMEIYGLEAGAPVSSRKGSNKSSLGAAAGPKHTASTMSTMSTRSTRSTATEASEVPPLMSAATAANQVRALAKKKPVAAWDKLQNEFETQQLVWQSLLLTQGKTKEGLQGRVEALQNRINSILGKRSVDPRKAGSALEDVLARDEGGDRMLNNSMTETGRDVLKQHRIAPLRLELAERIDTSGVPATLPQTKQDKDELVELVVSCDLADIRLARSVRHLLLLPIPAELGPPVTAHKTSSARRRTSSMESRKSSGRPAGCTASRKSSTPLGTAQVGPEACRTQSLQLGASTFSKHVEAI